MPLRSRNERDPDVLHPDVAEGSGKALGASLVTWSRLENPSLFGQLLNINSLPWSLLRPLVSFLQGERPCRSGQGLRLADTSPVGNRSKSHVPCRMQVHRRWTVWGKSVVLCQKCEWHHQDVITCSQGKVSF